MSNAFKEKNIHRLFTLSVLLKAANALLEIVFGALLFFSSRITEIVSSFAQGELIEDPNDFLANSLQHYLPYFSAHTQLFASVYLLSHGVIKIFLAMGLLRRRLWAYPSAIIVFSFFIVYQMYRYVYTHSFFLIFLTIFDILIVWLTLHEYRLLKKHVNTLN